MARIRTIKPEFFTSEDTVTLEPLARLLYIGLWTEADREGRLDWKPKSFKRRILPDDVCDIESLCQSLVEKGLIVLYGRSNEFAYIPTFLKHQHVNPREGPSKLPTPPDSDAWPTREARVTDASTTREHLDCDASSRVQPRVVTREHLDCDAQGGKERKGREGKGKEGTEDVSSPVEVSKTSETQINPKPSEPSEPAQESPTIAQDEPKPILVQGFINDTPEGLAALFRNNKSCPPNSQESFESCIEHIKQAFREGATVVQVRGEIDKLDRNRAEPIWTLLKRVIPPKDKPPPGGSRNRRLSKEEIDRQFAEMAKS